MVAADERLINVLLTSIRTREQRRFNRVELAHYKVMIERKLIRQREDGTYELTKTGERQLDRSDNSEAKTTETKNRTRDEDRADLPPNNETV